MRKHGSRLKSCRVLDLGCGTGVLALAAARLGAKVEGWDSDPVAVTEAQRNLRLNRVGTRVCFRQRDVLREAIPAADLIVANLYDHLLLHLLPRLESHRRAGTTLLLSGILKGQENGIIRTATKLGWKLERRGRLGRWFDSKPSPPAWRPSRRSATPPPCSHEKPNGCAHPRKRDDRETLSSTGDKRSSPGPASDCCNHTSSTPPPATR
jgi:SAM-dependent methyltransferase